MNEQVSQGESDEVSVPPEIPKEIVASLDTGGETNREVPMDEEMARRLGEASAKVEERVAEVGEKIKELTLSLTRAELALESEGRIVAKKLLEGPAGIYKQMMTLNGGTLDQWDSGGAFKEKEFRVLNRRRKILSNGIGMLTAQGVRHDLNVIEPLEE